MLTAVSTAGSAASGRGPRRRRPPWRRTRAARAGRCGIRASRPRPRAPRRPGRARPDAACFREDANLALRAVQEARSRAARRTRSARRRCRPLSPRPARRPDPGLLDRARGAALFVTDSRYSVSRPPPARALPAGVGGGPEARRFEARPDARGQRNRAKSSQQSAGWSERTQSEGWLTIPAACSLLSAGQPGGGQAVERERFRVVAQT